MAIGRVLFDVLSYKRLWKYTPPPPPPKKNAQFDVDIQWRTLKSSSFDKMTCVLSKSDKIDRTGANFGFVLWKWCRPSCSGRILLSIENRNRETILVKIMCELLKYPPTIKWWRCFCVQLQVNNIENTETSLSLYFWTYLNNLHTILTRIVSEFRFFHSKSKFDHCSSIGIVFKVRNQTWR